MDCKVKLKMDYVSCLYWIESEYNDAKTDTIYEEVHANRGKLLVKRNDKYGLLNCDLSSFVPVEYDGISSLYCRGAVYWVLTKNGKARLYDAKLNPRTEPIYDQINLAYSKYSSRIHGEYEISSFRAPLPHYFGIRSNNKSGIIDGAGRIIFPAEYDQIRLIVNKDWRSYSRINRSECIWVLRKGKTQEIRSWDTKLLYSDTTSLHENSPTFLDLDDQQVLVIQQKENSRHILLNTANLKVLGYNYVPNLIGQIIRFPHHSTQNKISYYDAHLNLIYTTKNRETIRSLNTPKERFLVERYKNRFVKVINDTGGTVMQGDYKHLQIRFFENEFYYWALKKESFDSTKKMHTFQFDIYTDEGVLLSNCEFNLREKDYKRNFALHNFFEDFNQYRGNYRDKEPKLLFGLKKDKWGAYNGAGKIVIPFAHDDYLGKEKNGTEIRDNAFVLLKDGKFGIVDQHYKTRHDFDYDFIFFNLGGKGINYFNGDERSFITSAKDTIIIDQIDTAFVDVWYRSKEFLTYSFVDHNSENYRSKDIFVVKADTLYTQYKGLFVRCDSTLLDFNYSLQAVSNYIVQKSGAVIKLPTTDKVHVFPEYYLSVGSNFAEVYDLNGFKTGRISNLKQALLVNGCLKVKTTADSVGLLSKNGLEWLVPPNYLEIIKDKAMENQYWVKNANIEDAEHFLEGEWQLINTQGETLLNGQAFNYPPLKENHVQKSSQTQNASIVKSGNKYGLLDKSNTLILRTAYDAIVPTTSANIYFIYKDGVWRLYSDTGITSKFYSEIVDNKAFPIFRASTFTAKDTLIEFIHFTPQDGAIVLTERASLNQVKKQQDLATIFSTIEPLDKNQKTAKELLYKSIYQSETAILEAIPLNNTFILQSFNLAANHYQNLNRYTLKLAQFFPENSHLDNVTSFETYAPIHNILFYNPEFNPNLNGTANHRKFLFANNGFYAFHETIYEWENHSRAEITYNYVLPISSDPIDFYSLFERQANVDAVLYDYLQNLVNEKQLFGATCLNFPEVYAKYTENYQFVSGGIAFFQSSGEFFIESWTRNAYVPYEILKPLLKPDIAALGEW
ncbi:MAG: hypothetical protein GQ574_23855 [Crocinitomix sp.]|nr:hypothetical protein [Crocinitomix sp.]